MNKRRLKEIKDSIDLQCELWKECENTILIDEEKELYNEVISRTGLSIGKYSILPPKVYVNGVEITDVESWNKSIDKIVEKDKEIERLTKELELERQIKKEAINHIKEESWFCCKDNEEVIDRIPIEKLLEILGDNDENI